MLDNYCNNCPRYCKSASFCGKEKSKIRIAKVMRHKYEEPLLCPEHLGSGAVFFSNCSLKCVFCQNYQISHLGKGKDFSIEELADIFKKVERSGVANLNLVTPTHYTDDILKAFKIFKPSIPIIWNTSGYEDENVILSLEKYVDIFLFDVKYYDKNLSMKYSKAPDYFEKCIIALKLARKIIGKDLIVNGQMKRGIIIRHLVLPGQYEDSIKIFKMIKKELGNDIYISIMSQYVPFYKANDFPEINRKLKPIEYKKVVKEVRKLGFNKGFIQDISSANYEYTPEFDFKKFFEL